MAIKVNYLDGGKGIEFILSDVIKGSDIIKIHKEVHTPEVIAALRYKIIDKSKVKENYVSSEEVDTISKLDRKINTINNKTIIAFISPNDLIKSIGELWKAMSDGEHNTIKIFSTREDADKWIIKKLNES